MKAKIFSLALFLGMVSAWAQENYGQWSSYRVITVNTTNSGGGANTTADLVKFPVLVRLTSAQADVFTGALANGADIRFSKADGTTPLKYQIERWNAGGQAAEIWVLMDSVKANNNTQTIRMYWGKAGSADSSKGAAVFETANGFQGAWHLGEATSSPALDATANNFHGTPGTTGTGGNPFDTVGVIGQAKSFRSSGGTSGSFFVMDGTAGGGAQNTTTGILNFDPAGPWTVSVWARSYGATTGHIASKGDGAWQLSKRNSGSEWTLFTNPSTTATTANGRTVSISSTGGHGVWKHLTGVRTAAGAGGGILYVDGVAVGSNNTVGVTAPGANLYPFSLGRSPSATDKQFLLGAVDEVTVSSVIRSASWVKLSYESQKPGATCVSLGATQTSATAPSGLTYLLNPAVYTVGIAIANNTPTITAGSAPVYTVSPALPAGLALNPTTGVLSGTPTTATAAAGYTVTATNGAGSTTVSVSITVNPAAPAGLAYSVNPVTYVVNAAIANNTPSSTGGAPSAYAVSPALPAGLVLNTSTGVISGTPTAIAAAANYTVTASNVTGSTTVNVNITISATLIAPSNLTYPANPAIYAVNAAITANNPSYAGGTPTGFAVSPGLPSGLALNTATGSITGTPTSASAAAFYVVTASNSAGSATISVNITVLAPPSALAYSVNPATYALNLPIASNPPSVTGVVSSYSVSPALPAGLTLNSGTGVLSGTPTVLQAATNYTVTAGNLAGTTTVVLNITVLAAPSGLSYSLNPAAYVQNAAVLPNTPTVTGSPATFSVSPALPAGLSLNTGTGVISGTPTTVTAAANYTVTATNAAGSTTVTLSITVTNPVNGVFFRGNAAQAFIVRIPGSAALTFPWPDGKIAGARFSILDLRGQVVWTRIAALGEGVMELAWDGNAPNGRRAAAGSYIVRMSAMDGRQKEISIVERKITYAP